MKKEIERNLKKKVIEVYQLSYTSAKFSKDYFVQIPLSPTKCPLAGTHKNDRFLKTSQLISLYRDVSVSAVGTDY